MAAALLASSSCGLEYYAYLNPPEYGSTVNAEGSFTFYSPDDPGLYFTGYAIYYKLLTDQEASAFDESTVQDVDDLTAAGFLPLTANGDTTVSLPLVRILQADRDTPHTVTVTFPYSEQPNVTTTLDGYDPIYLRRGAADPTPETVDDQTFLGFDEFSAADVAPPGTDLSQAAWDQLSSTTSLKVMLFVASYGWNRNDAVPITSEPLYLFYIDYTPGVTL